MATYYNVTACLSATDILVIVLRQIQDDPPARQIGQSRRQPRRRQRRERPPIDDDVVGEVRPRGSVLLFVILRWKPQAQRGAVAVRFDRVQGVHSVLAAGRRRRCEVRGTEYVGPAARDDRQRRIRGERGGIVRA